MPQRRSPREKYQGKVLSFGGRRRYLSLRTLIIMLGENEIREFTLKEDHVEYKTINPSIG
jgi:hypothetical protein